MPILALDTATEVATAAVVKDGKVLSEVSWASPRTHSERILPAVDLVLQQAGIARGDITLLAVSKGPGSFTGLRIGMALAKGLAEGLGVDIVAISTLRVLAEQARLHRGLILPALCAQRQQYYCALYESSALGLTELMPDSVVSASDVQDWLDGQNQEVLLVGEGARELEGLTGFLAAPEFVSIPRAGVLGVLASSSSAVPPHKLLPNYIRPSSAKPPGKEVKSHVRN